MDFIENVIVNSSSWEEGDAACLFGTQPVVFTDATTLEELLVELGIWPSVTQARRAGKRGPIPSGYTESYKASKYRRLWIWNPDKNSDDYVAEEASRREADAADASRAMAAVEGCF